MSPGGLLTKTDLPRDTSRVPRVSVIFIIDKNRTGEIHFESLNLDVETNPEPFVNFELFSNPVQTDGRLESFEQLSETVISNGDLPLWELDLLAADDRRMLDLWNATDQPLPTAPSIQWFFEDQADRQPEAVALLAGGRSFTYRELDRHANALAAELQLNGVRRESLVGVCATRGPELLIAILAVLKAGGAYVPLDPKYPKDRIAYILEDAAAPVLLTQRALVDSLPADDGSLRIFIDDATLHTADRQASATVPQDLAYVIYTSGSTGLPKGVAIEHRSAIALIGWAKTIYAQEELAAVLFSTSICFDLSVFEMFVTLGCGGALVLAENALDLVGHPHREKLTLINTVPSAITGLLEAELLPSGLKVINLAGEVLTTQLANRLYAALPAIKLYDLYGPSEDTTYSTVALRRPGGRATIGRPISNTKAYIVNDQGKLTPPGVAGELLLGGAGLARGYLNRPELTAEKFIPDPFDTTPGARIYRTGDRARFYENGEIQFLGRLDHQVKLRGFRIELGEIESRLEDHPAVAKAVAHVVDQRLIAYVTVSAALPEGDGTATWQPATPARFNRFPEILRAHLATSLPEYMVPALIFQLEAFPLTPNGKVDRKALPAPTPARATGKTGASAAPANPTEAKLVEIWQQVLDKDGIRTGDDIFALGGDSILIFQITTRVTRAGIALSPAQVFRLRTIQAIAAEILAANTKPAAPAIPRVNRDTYRRNF